MTLAASKRCGLSCRWALVLQRSTKKRPVFFFFLQSPKAIMWETSRTGSGFPPPASPFRCLAALPREKPSHLSPPLSLQVQSLHPSHVSPLLFMIFPHFISPNRILHQTHHFFPSRLASQRTYHPAPASTCLPAAPPGSSLISVAPQRPIVRSGCQVCRRHGNHAEE